MSAKYFAAAFHKKTFQVPEVELTMRQQIFATLRRLMSERGIDAALNQAIRFVEEGYGLDVDVALSHLQ